MFKITRFFLALLCMLALPSVSMATVLLPHSQATLGEELIGVGNNLEVAPTSTITYFGRWENQCGYSDCQSVTVNVIDVPNQPLSVIGETVVCSGSLQNYLVENNADVNYHWSLPNDWSGCSSSNEIDVTIGNSGGIISV